MPDATVASATIRPEEAAHFAALAKDWWDPKGSSAMLHRLNPVRLAFLREAIDLHWGGDVETVKPLAARFLCLAGSIVASKVRVRCPGRSCT